MDLKQADEEINEGCYRNINGIKTFITKPIFGFESQLKKLVKTAIDIIEDQNFYNQINILILVR